MFKFCKYSSTGNDFILVDNRNKSFLVNSQYIQRICDRNFGIGADGLILLESDVSADYFMNYFNSDGLPSSFCGNGNLCCTHFARDLGIVSTTGCFATREGRFNFKIKKDYVSISMLDVLDFDINSNRIIINTGSPHYVIFKSDVKNLDVNKEAYKIRYNKAFLKNGINVTFAEFIKKKILFIRTYERGVESETLSCGTGAVAAALAASIHNLISTNSVTVNTRGGSLQVQFQNNNNMFSHIILSTEVKKIFKGHYLED